MQKIANSILKNNRKYLENSVLSEKQIKEILEG